MSQSVKEKVDRRIFGKGRGWVFTPSHFIDLGTAKAVEMALRHLLNAGTIRRLARGLYDYPRKHPKLGLLSPDPNDIARAVSKSDATRLQPSGAYAANLLGLSQQVPMRIVFLTDGAEKTVQVGKQSIQMRRTTPKNMATAGRPSGLVIQALRYLGNGKVTSQHIKTLQRNLSPEDRARLWKDRIHAPAWMHPILKEISEKGTAS